MKEVFEAMLGVFFIITVMFTSTAIISTSIDARNADATMQAYVTEVEHSNFASSVLQAVFSQATADGFQDIRMVFYEKDDLGNVSKRNVNNWSSVGTTHRVYMVKLSMKYDYELDFINKKSEHVMTAYAR